MKKIGIAAALSALVLLQLSCTKENIPALPASYDNVVVLYSCAYNNLSSSILDNMDKICGGPLPMKSDRSALVWITHNADSNYDWSTPTRPSIIRVTSDWSGAPVLDTLKQYDSGVSLTDTDIMRDALLYVGDNFKSSHYGLVYSSHGTGWLPQGYYEKSVSGVFPAAPEFMIPHYEDIMLKSIGATYSSTPHYTSSEMEIGDLASAIPIHLDYIIFDACLMGGVEVAYELRNVTDMIGFSQAEVLATGFDYSTFARRLLVENDPESWCEDYFNLYMAETGRNQSATISVVSCDALEPLALVCARLFEKYRSEIAALDPDSVQGFFRLERHYFYDLEDIFVKAGASEADLGSLRDALRACVLYEAHTPEFLLWFAINTSCGLSSFLPAAESDVALRDFYKTLAWNKATGFVE